MNDRRRNHLWVIAVLTATVGLVVLLPVTGYLREANADDIGGWRPAFLFVFLLFDVLWNGIPAWVHRSYVGDYGQIRSMKIFALWGGFTGALLGEIALGASSVLILPYTIFMPIYGFLYKRFAWWKVGITYLAFPALSRNTITREARSLLGTHAKLRMNAGEQQGFMHLDRHVVSTV
jgi:hypothetical protein